MTPESFPTRGPDGEEPEGYRPLPAGGNEPEDGLTRPEQGLFVCLPAEELTLAGFAQNGRSDTMVPGALLAIFSKGFAVNFSMSLPSSQGTRASWRKEVSRALPEADRH